MESKTPEPFIRIAYIAKPHGIRGAVKIEVLGNDLSRFKKGLNVFTEDAHRKLTFEHVDAQYGNDCLATFQEVTDRNQSELLRNTYLVVPMEQARALGKEEWFIHDLIGLDVIDETTTHRGCIDDIEHYTGNDVVVIRKDDGSLLRIPMVQDCVQQVDIEAGKMQISQWAFDEMDTHDGPEQQ